MTDFSIELGSEQWALAAIALAAVGVITLVWSYWRSPTSRLVTALAASLKAIGIAALALCLLEPLLIGTRPRKGANIFAVAADNSRSLTIHDAGDSQSRGEMLQAALQEDSAWQDRLAEDFEAQRFVFDGHLRAVTDFSSLPFDGDRTALTATLNAISRRFHNLPLAGVLLFTDGNATDEGDIPWDQLPPIYPVVSGKDEVAPDISVPRVSVSQTNFESAPVVIRADIETNGMAGEEILATLFDQDGKEIETQKVERAGPGAPLAVRFQVRPESPGVSFYRVHVETPETEIESTPSENPAVLPSTSATSPSAGESSLATEVVTIEPPPHVTSPTEATLANNDRTIVVDRGGGPYRVLYVCGRPNADYKFLRRALEDDDQLELVAIVRIAKREPKFTFGINQDTNPLFNNFDNIEAEDAERYDQPVLLRIGTEDENELRDGFPKTADALYRYDAIILDDVEAEFFTEDQMTLVEKFVNRRGGGLLMMGGLDSFTNGKYYRTPIGNMLPVYLDNESSVTGDHDYHLALTRYGWLQPWVRLRNTEPDEQKRLSIMSHFKSLSPSGRAKPAAAVLAEVIDETGAAQPALVTQRFGDGRTAALLVADMWRTGLKRPDPLEDDLAKSWRQTVRWLVADVPRRVEVVVAPQPSSETGAVSIVVRVRDAEFLPLDNAQVSVEVCGPNGKTLSIPAEPNPGEAGSYSARHVPRDAGAYRASIKVAGPDGAEIGQREAGWVAQPVADEFSQLRPNRAALAQIAAKTGGEVIAVDKLPEFVASLPSRKVPLTEPVVRPLWHQPLFFLFVIGCLATEWGLRRWKGLA